MKRLNLFILVFITPMIIWAQVLETGKVSPYTAHVISAIHNGSNDSTARKQLSKRYALKSVDNTTYINAFIKTDTGSDLELLSQYGVKINSVFPNWVTAQIPISQLESVALSPKVKYLQVGIPVRKRMDIARASANVNQVQLGTDLSTPFTGKNVIVGIIDNGFEYGHINFFQSDNSTLRVKKVWNQNTTGTKPTGYSYGTEYATQAAILAAQYDNSTETHGTHVTGIAAGGDKNNSKTYYGVAPEADIVLVSYNQDDQTTDNVGIADGIKYIYDYATEQGKPCVINMSLGMHVGPHDGTSTFDQVCDGLQGKGRLLVGAAGNEGSDPLHISQTFNSSNTTLKSFVKFLDSSNKYSGIDIWGDVDKNYTVRVIVYNKNTNTELFTSVDLNANTTNSKSYTLTTSKNGAAGKIAIYTEKNTTNSKSNAYVDVSLTSISSGNYIGVIITSTDGTVNAWTDDYYSTFTGNNISGWTNGDALNSVGEIGGTGKQIISVGAFATRISFTNINGSKYNTSETLNDIADFSSKGPAIDGRMKPDITAPGTSILSSYSSAVIATDDYKDYVVAKNIVNGKTHYYGEMDGTSMATPFVTGVLADWLSADATLSPDDIRQIFKKTAINDTFTGSILATGSTTWGYGKIDAWNGIKEVLKSKVLSVDAVKQNNGTAILYPTIAEQNTSLLFTQNDSEVQLSVYSMSGKLVYMCMLGVVTPAQEKTINLNNFEKGIYLVKVSGVQYIQTFRLIVK